MGLFRKSEFDRLMEEEEARKRLEAIKRHEELIESIFYPGHVSEEGRRVYQKMAAFDLSDASRALAYLIARVKKLEEEVLALKEKAP